MVGKETTYLIGNTAEEKGTHPFGDIFAAEDDLREGSQKAISGILCFDLLPLQRSSHLGVIVYQAATALLSPSGHFGSHLAQLCSLRGKINLSRPRYSVVASPSPRRVCTFHRQCSEVDIACVWMWGGC